MLSMEYKKGSKWFRKIILQKATHQRVMFCKNAQRLHSFTKTLRHTLVQVARVPFCSVVAFFCRPALKAGQVVTELDVTAIAKLGPQSSREEVGVHNLQKPGDHSCCSDWHIRKISQGLEPRELRRRLLEHSVIQSK